MRDTFGDLVSIFYFTSQGLCPYILHLLPTFFIFQTGSPSTSPTMLNYDLCSWCLYMSIIRSGYALLFKNTFNISHYLIVNYILPPVDLLLSTAAMSSLLSAGFPYHFHAFNLTNSSKFHKVVSRDFISQNTYVSAGTPASMSVSLGSAGVCAGMRSASVSKEETGVSGPRRWMSTRSRVYS